MKSKIKKIIIKLLKITIPNKLYFYLRNIFKITKINFEDITKVINLLDVANRELKFLRDEVERAKLRSIIVDGKLNYLLYGKVNERDGTVDQKLVQRRKTTEEINTNVDFTILLRGSIDTLKIRYRERLKNLNSKGVVDKTFLDGKSLIDLGAGNGHVSSIFYDTYKFSTVIGVDAYCNHFEDEKLRKFEYVNSDVMSFLASADKKYYFISAVHILEHLCLSDQYYFFKKCYDLLEHGGYLYIEMPNVYNYRTLADNFWADEQHLRPFPMNAFRILSEKIGYSPYYGVYDGAENFLNLDEYLNANNFFDNQYNDIFLVLRKL